MKQKHLVFNCWNTARIATIICLSIALSSARLHAQGYGTIRGTVTDPSGALIASATVTATQTQTGRATTVTSGSDGTYVFPTLAPSDYSLSASASGFEDYTRTQVTLQANQALTVNIKLQVGAASQTVSVSGDAPQVDTTTGTLSQVVDQARVVDLPLNGRNAALLSTLVAGVVSAPADSTDQGNTKTLPVVAYISANGSRAEQTNYLLNGGNNVDELTDVNAPYPFPDALQEFSVQTSNYSAQFGQSSGAVVNIVTKSGGSQFHGDAFEFLRNGYFNAKPFFATRADTLHRHQFGGTIGGPVIIPHLSTGKSTKFFFGYQHTLIHQLSNSSTATVPTPAEEGAGSTYADFGSLCSAGWNSSNLCSNASQQIVNPFTGVSYPLNQIPTSALDKGAMAVLAHIPTYPGTPAPGKVGGVVNYYVPTTQSFDEYIARVDHSFGQNDHLFGHYYQDFFQNQSVYIPSNLLAYSGFSNIRYQNALLSETHTFSSNLLNNFVANYQREVALRGGPPGGPDITAFGVNIWQPSLGTNLTGVSATGYFSLAGLPSSIWERGNNTFNDDLHWVKGKHDFAFGGHFEISKVDIVNINAENGQFITAAYSSYVNALANLEMGYLTSFNQGQAYTVNDRNHFPAIYAQDTWTLTHRLTLDYGIRWERFSPWANKYFGGNEAFFPALYAANTTSKLWPNLPAGLLASGDTGMVFNGVDNQYKQFMPRVGFAYDLFGDGKTAVRGGAGIFYMDRLQGFFNLNQNGLSPFSIYETLTDLGGTNTGGPFSNPYCTGCTPGVGTAGPISNPFPYTLPFPASYVWPVGLTVEEYVPSGQFQVPVTDDYNLTIEHQFTSTWSARAAYVGSISRHQFVNLDLNPAVNNGSGLSTNQRRSYNTPPVVGPCTTAAGCATRYASMIEASMSGSGNYNSLQMSLEKKLSNGLSVLANYTWSKALDDMPYGTQDADLNFSESYAYPIYPAGASSWYPTDYKALDRGRSDFDRPNAVSISYVYDLPKVHQGNRFLQSVTNGWMTTGLIQHHSGDALTVTAGEDVSLTGLDQDRGQQSSGAAVYNKALRGGTCSANANCYSWFNAKSFALPVNSGPGTGYGNVVKGSLRGPGYTNWDGAVIRTFPIYRESNLEFRAEYFDLLNHPILGDPATTVTSGTFGQITSEGGALSSSGATGPRIAQFSLKINF